MVFSLKKNLLIDILAYDNATPLKYSKCLLNLKTIFEIEKQESFKYPDYFYKIFNELREKEKNFINNIPLLIVEKYFYAKNQNLNGFVSISYLIPNEKGENIEHNLNMSSNDLYLILEDYFSKIFMLASLMANYYNLEIKVNDTATKNKTFI